MLLIAMLVLAQSADEVRNGECTASTIENNVNVSINLPFYIYKNKSFDVNPATILEKVDAVSSAVGSGATIVSSSFRRTSSYTATGSFKYVASILSSKMKFAEGRVLHGPFVITVVQNGKIIFQLPYPARLDGDVLNLKLHSGLWPGFETQATGRFAVRYSGGDELLAESTLNVPAFVQRPLNLPASWPKQDGVYMPGGTLPAGCSAAG